MKRRNHIKKPLKIYHDGNILYCLIDLFMYLLKSAVAGYPFLHEPGFQRDKEFG